MLDLKTILIPIDLSSGAEAALSLGLHLADKHGAAVRMVHVSDSAAGSRAFEMDYRTRVRTDIFDRPDVEFVSLVDSWVEGAIVRTARQLDADMIVIGKHGSRTTERLLTYLGAFEQVIGSTAEYVIRASQRPVLLASPRFAHGPVDIRRILVAIDFSSYTPAALRLGRELGALFEADVEYLHVIENGESDGVVDAGAIVDREIAADGLTVERGPAERVILDHLRRCGADFLAIHSHGSTSDRRARIGHVAEKLVQSAPCSVLTVKSYGKPPVQPDQSDRDRAAYLLASTARA